MGADPPRSPLLAAAVRGQATDSAIHAVVRADLGSSNHQAGRMNHPATCADTTSIVVLEALGAALTPGVAQTAWFGDVVIDAQRFIADHLRPSSRPDWDAQVHEIWSMLATLRPQQRRAHLEAIEAEGSDSAQARVVAAMKQSYLLCLCTSQAGATALFRAGEDVDGYVPITGDVVPRCGSVGRAAGTISYLRELEL